MRSLWGKIFFALISFLLISACSSSSNTLRYGKQDSEEKETKDPSVRFTSVDDSMVVDLNLDLKDPNELPAEEPDVDVSSLLATNQNYTFDLPGYDYTTIREKMLMEIIKYLGTPYKYGGNTKDGIDCSAFTQTVYKDVFNIQLERSARLQYKQGEEIEKGEELKYGDLVFFNTRQRVKPGHVGIYIGDNLFAHASTKKGVTITSINYDYYARTFMGARRFETNGLTEKTQ